MSRGEPLDGDRGAKDVINFGNLHANDIEASTLRRHLPLPGAVGGLGRSDGTDWQRIDGDAFYVLRSHWLQSGFLDATEVSLAWDDASRTLTVDAVGANFNYFHDGLLYTKTSAQTKQITDTEGLWLFYFDGATLDAANNPNHAKIDDVYKNEAAVVYVYWDATNNDGRLIYNMHGASMAPATHAYQHFSVGAVYESGMALADFVIDDSGDDAEDAQFSMALGVFQDEDLEFTLTAINKTTGAEIWYLDGASWRWTTNAGYSILTTGSGRMAWNDGGAQSEVANNQFALCHILGTSIGDDAGANPKFIAAQGQATYATKKLARAGAETEINALVYGTLPIQEVIEVGTIIFQTSNGYANAVKSRTVSTDAGDNYIDWRGTNPKAAGGSIADHGALAGLADPDHDHNTALFGHQGGSASERYHLTAAQHTALGAVAGQVNTLIWIGW